MTRRFQKVIALCLIMTQVPIWCTGCWDSLEINDRSVILEFAIDKNIEEPDLKEKQYTITYTLPDMAKLSGTNSLVEDISTNVIVKAPTIAASIDDLETRAQHTVTFSHVKAMLVGKQLLEDRALFESMISSVARDMLIARNTPIVAVDGTAEEVVSKQNPQNPILGIYLLNYFNNKERPISYFKPQLLGNFIRDMEETGIATMPILHMEEEGEISINGGAVMQDYKLVDFITREEVKGQLFIQGEIKNAPVVTNYNDQYVTYIIKREKSKIRFEETSEGLICKVKIETSGEISDYNTQQNERIFEHDQIKRLQGLIEQEIIKQAQLGVNKAKDLGVDFVGLGVEMYRKQNRLWEKYKDTWHTSTFREVPVYIEAKVDIKSTGILE